MSSREGSRNGVVNERALYFLKVLAERYIRDGEPIGSRTLAKDSGMDLSPATIRNVMSDLEELGLVASPHTSAGRVPTSSGYRMFIDSLITLKPLDSEEMTRLQRDLVGETDRGSLVQSASRLLSGLTHMAGVVMIPKRDDVRLRQIEFLPMSGTRVLTILVTSSGEVHNRLIDTQRVYSRSELEQSANYITRHFAGVPLEAIHDRLVQEMQEARDGMNRIMSEAMEMADQVLESAREAEDCVISGQTNLMDFDELAQMDRLRELFNSFTEKRELLHLLDESMRAQGVQIFIGDESGYRPLEACSLVTAPYEVDNRVMGVLGVIGPTRMAYDRVIPIVDVTAKLLGAALKSR